MLSKFAAFIFYAYVALKDIDTYVFNEQAKQFFKQEMIYAININDINRFFDWIARMLIITGSKNKTLQVDNALKFKVESEHYDEHEFNCIHTEKDQFAANYKKSPFYLKASRMLMNAMKNSAVNGDKNSYYNEKYNKLLLCKFAAFAPLWTNLMGVYIETSNKTRISNSFVESYFNIVRNITLEGQRFIRSSEYVRLSYVYMQAKINEIEMEYMEK